jgi:3-oxoadipate enol-lactonase
MIMKNITVNNLNIAYEDEGKGDIVVLLHGFCGRSQYWKHITPKLSPNHRVIVPDLRGHGQTEAAPGSSTMELMAEDLKQLLDELEISNIVLFGHSLGGYVALAFAEKYPQMLSAFSLIHSTARPDDTAAKENRLKAVQSIKEEGINPFIDTLIPKLFAPDHVNSMPDLITEAKQIGYQTASDGAIHALEGMRERKDRNHVLRNSTVPVLLTAGEQDQVIPVEKTFSVEGPHLTQARIQNAGHMSMFEAPDQLLAVMERFLRDNSPGIKPPAVD